MIEDTKDRRLRESLSTFVTERLIPRIVPEISAPESFRLKKLMGSLMVAIAPYSDPWSALEAVVQGMDEEAQMIDIAELKRISEACSGIRKTLYNLRHVGGNVQMKFKWTESTTEGIWACNVMGFGTARIHPGEGEWNWKLIINLDKGSGHLDNSMSGNHLETLMEYFENEAIRSGTPFQARG